MVVSGLTYVFEGNDLLIKGEDIMTFSAATLHAAQADEFTNPIAEESQMLVLQCSPLGSLSRSMGCS